MGTWENLSCPPDQLLQLVRCRSERGTGFHPDTLRAPPTRPLFGLSRNPTEVTGPLQRPHHLLEWVQPGLSACSLCRLQHYTDNQETLGIFLWVKNTSVSPSTSTGQVSKSGAIHKQVHSDNCSELPSLLKLTKTLLSSSQKKKNHHHPNAPTSYFSWPAAPSSSSPGPGFPASVSPLAPDGREALPR